MIFMYKPGDEVVFTTRKNDMMNFNNRACRIVEAYAGTDDDMPMYKIEFIDSSMIVFADEVRAPFKEEEIGDDDD